MRLTHATNRASKAAFASFRAVFKSGAVTKATANFPAASNGSRLQFLDFDIAVKNLGELELQRDFALFERDPLVFDELLDLSGAVIHLAINDVHRSVAPHDHLDLVPAIMFAHRVLNHSPN